MATNTVTERHAPPAPVADADTLAGYRFTIIPHTHWDREWYQPFEVFRIRLVRAVERICDVLDLPRSPSTGPT